MNRVRINKVNNCTPSSIKGNEALQRFNEIQGIIARV